MSRIDKSVPLQLEMDNRAVCSKDFKGAELFSCESIGFLSGDRSRFLFG